MDESKENNFLNKLNNSSKNIFLKCLNTLNKETDVKIAFYNFLFGDLITLGINENNYNIDLYEIVENPENILNNFISNIFEKIAESDSDINYYNILKKKLSEKKTIIQNKIKECNSHIEILKNEYININLEKYIPLNVQSKLLFENKTVLYLKKYNFVLGEFFTRFIFSLIYLKEDNNNSLDNLCNKKNFYSDEKVNDYMNNDDTNINEFEKINNNFKYWIFLFFCTYQFFDKTSKYNIIFNETEFNSYINTLVKIENAPQKQKQHKKNKGQKQKGSGNIKDILKDTNKKERDKKIIKQNTKQISDYNKIINLKKMYNIIANETFIETNINLGQKYYKPFSKNMIEYFKNKINAISNTGEINIKNNKIENPFSKKNINISSIIKTNKQKFSKESIEKIIVQNLNFDIFQSLYLFLDQNNKKEFEIFINKLKYNLILILFFLYNIKKKLYENYLLINKEKFNINNKKENNKKENNKKENNRKENNKKENNALSLDYKKVNINNLKETNKINIKIKLLENKLLTLDDKKGIKNYNEEILNIESQISRLHVQKYNAKK